MIVMAPESKTEDMLSYLDSKLSRLREQLEHVRSPLDSLPLLDELSFYLSRVDPAAAEVYARRQLRSAAALGAVKWKMRSHLRLAGVSSVRHHYSRALPRLMKAWKLLDDLPDNPAERAYISRHIAEMYHHTGDSPTAIRYLNSALAYARQSGDPREVVATLGAAGDCYVVLGLYSTALMLMNEAAEIYEGLLPSDPYAANGLAHLQLLLGRVYQATEEWEHAARAYEKGIALLRETGDRSGEIVAYQGLGAVAVGRKDYERAFEQYRTGLSMAAEADSVMDILLALLSIGSLHMLRKQYEEAEDCMDEVERRLTEVEHDAFRTRVRIDRAELRLAQGRPEETIALLSEVADRQWEDAHGGVGDRIHLLLAEAYERQGKLAESLRRYRRVLEIERDTITNQVQRRLLQFEIGREAHVLEVRKSLEGRGALPAEAGKEDPDAAAVTRRLDRINTLLHHLHRHARERLSEDPDSRELLEEIDRGVREGRGFSRSWEAFRQQLQVVDPMFIGALSEHCPAMTPAELRICWLLRMNRSNTEVAGLLKISGRTLDKHRANIRKKLGLHRKDNIVAFLARFRSE